MTPEFAELAKVFGIPIAIAIGILWAGARDIWVYGNRFREMKEDRDYFRDLAFKGTDLADKALDTPARRPRRGPHP